MSVHIAINTPLQLLSCQEAFSTLTKQEQYYVFYLHQAIWKGGFPITLFQRSYESPGLFLLAWAMFQGAPFEETKQKIIAQVGQSQWEKFLCYIAGIFGQTGNYFSYGETKFIPELSPEEFEQILNLSSSPYKTEMLEIYELTKPRIFSIDRKIINFIEKGGDNSYYSINVTPADAELISKWLKSQNAVEQALNSRVWKLQDGFHFKVSSLSGHHFFKNPALNQKEHEFEGQRIFVDTGDFNIFVSRLVEHIAQALPYVANSTQQDALTQLLAHFTSGDIEFHRRHYLSWVKDIAPIVESQIGFIETYVDPLEVRAEFEGFVAAVNKPRSAMYKRLVDMAPQLLAQFPWSSAFEHDQFHAPDFSGLDVIAFATTYVPIGINLPNFDDIRQDLGFKNVILENNPLKITRQNADFILPEELEIVIAETDAVFPITVSLHELLGHGSGKLFIETIVDGESQKNFDPATVNPLTNAPVATFYKPNENWNTVFGDIKGSFEECRAETVALYISCIDEIYEIFGVPQERIENVRFALWVNMMVQGLQGMMRYNVENQKWMQAHSQGRFAILKALLEEPQLLTLQWNEDKSYFYLKFDKQAIGTLGKEVIGRFLQKLHIYRCTADIENAAPFYAQYTAVDEYWLHVREIVLANVKPRRMNICATLKMEGDEVHVKEYPETLEGLIESFMDRYQEFDRELYELWKEEFRLQMSL